jgi:DNA polymerase-3 subunit epsilon
MMPKANTVVILDFETTGLSPDNGDRAIEIGAVRIENGEIVDRFQELMNPGRRISGFIEDYTGITNEMLKNAASCREVMHKFSDFISGYNLVAHNASFDKRFLDAELERISKTYSGEFACSMLVSRRIYQGAANHKLGTLIEYANIPVDGVFHRALYDSEMTTKLWLSMLDHISSQYNIASIPFALIQRLARIPKKSVHKFLEGKGAREQ